MRRSFKSNAGMERKTSQPNLSAAPERLQCKDLLQNKTKAEKRGRKNREEGKEAENSQAVGVCMHQHHNDERS